MAFDPLLAVEGGGYISLIKALPPLLVLVVWARMMTWADKDAVDAHLPRVPLNVSFLAGLVAAYGLFFFLPNFLIAFAALLFIFIAEVATYLLLRQQKVGLTDLKEQFNEWLKSKKGAPKKEKEQPNQVTVIGKGGAAMPAPTAEDPARPAFDSLQAALTEPLRKAAELITLAPSENGVSVRYQVDGMDYKGQVVEKTTGSTAITLLKGAAGLDVNDRRKPQRAMVKLMIDGKRR